MPIYEYVCADCGKKTEAIRSMSKADEPITCAHCGGEKTHRAISKCFARGGGSDSDDGYSAASSSSGCSGCSGGSCSTCGH